MFKQVLLQSIILSFAALPVLAQMPPGKSPGSTEGHSTAAPPPDIDMTKKSSAAGGVPTIIMTTGKATPAPVIVDSRPATNDAIRHSFNERLMDLSSQVKSARDRGWLNKERFQSLNREHDRLVQAIDDADLAGWPSAQISKIDKDLSFFGAEVSSSMKVETAGKAGVWQ